MLNFPIRIVSVETKREWDGLAMSSRNRYLSQQERQTSLCLWKALEAAKLRADGGASLAQVLEEGRRVFGQESGGKAQLDYLEAVGAETFEKVEDAEGFHGKGALVLLLIAAFVGATRLIDNIQILI
jgi:pantoate--beta-alanine ligase